MNTDKRIRILTDDEKEALYARPQFTEEERSFFFELTHDEESLLKGTFNLARKVYSIVLLGYFKSKHQIFQFDLQEVKADTQYVLKRYFPGEDIGKTSLGREAKRLSQLAILKFMGYRIYDPAADGAILLNKACELCSISVDPIFIFRELIAVLAHQKITLPGYTTVQEQIISKALKSEQQRIAVIFKKHLSKTDRAKIFTLFEQSDQFYAITALKKDPKNFKLTAIRKEVAQYHQYKALHEITMNILPKLGISKNATAYYASLVELYTVRGLDRLQQDQTCLWLLCFIHQRYQSMLDNLTAMFIYTASQYKSDVIEKAEELLIKQMMESSEQDEKVAKLLRFYTDQSIDEQQAFGNIRKNAYAVLPAPQIDQIANELEDKNQKAKQLAVLRWHAVELFSKTYKPPLRALLQALTLEGQQHKALQKACQFLQNALCKEQVLSKIPHEEFPKQFIGKQDKAFIYDSNALNLNRYEYECYQQVAEYINGRSLFVLNSGRYRSLESELLPNWQQNKSAVLLKLNRPLLNSPLKQFIEEKAKPLDEKIILINEAIRSGENPYLKVKQQEDGSRIWTLPYTKKSKDLNNPFYEKIPLVSIINVLQFVNQQTKFMQAFTHIKPHYSKSTQDELSIYGGLIANGTNLGVGKMAGLCDFPLSSLNVADKSFIRLATLQAANDIVSNNISRLPIFRHWNLNPDLLHASLDGTKLATERETLLSRHSPKYFGLIKGVVGYFLIANHVPINSMIIGANEHESHFLFDLIYNNTSEIQPDRISHV